MSFPCGAVPPIIPPTSTSGIAANGALTLSTAINAAYPTAYMYFPAAIVQTSGAGAAAGWYPVIMTSSSAALVNGLMGQYVQGTPYFPRQYASYSGAGAASYTQSTSAIASLQFNIPERVIQTGACIRGTLSITYSTATSITLAVVLGGQTLTTFTLPSSSTHAELSWITRCMYAAILEATGNVSGTTLTISSFGTLLGQQQSGLQNMGIVPGSVISGSNSNGMFVHGNGISAGTRISASGNGAPGNYTINNSQSAGTQEPILLGLAQLQTTPTGLNIGSGYGSTASTFSTVDPSVASLYALNVTLGAASNYFVLEGYNFELLTP